MLSFQRCKTALAALLGAAAFAAPPAAQAVTYALKAAAYQETQPDGTQVTMWGYRASVANPTAAQVNTLAGQTTGFTSPGPALVVPPGDNTLSIVLINGLPNGRASSIVVHGLVNGSDPVFATAAGVACTPGAGSLADQRACRLRSLTQETPNGTAAAQRRTYTFSNVAPGTYLYQSGTHQQIQVQMGLYGMLSKDAQTSGTQRYAYGSAAALTAPFENETKLVFSEIDRTLHALVAANVFAGSTIEYSPSIFRLHRYNGTTPVRLQHSAPNSSNQVVSIVPGQRQLLRLVNAGLTSRAPALRDGHLQLVAEDAKPYPYPREQSVALLPAAKATDALIVPSLSPQAAASPNVGEREIVLFDRRAGLLTTADGRLNGDFLRLRMTTADAAPTLDLSSLALTAVQGVAYAGQAAATGIAPLRFSLMQAPAGMTIDAATGEIAWTPTNDQAQTPLQPTLTHAVTVKVDAANGRSTLGSVVIAVVNADDMPVANPDTLLVAGGLASIAAAQGVLANDFDPDGGTLGNAALAVAPAVSVDSFTLNADGSLSVDVRSQSWFRAIGPTSSRAVPFTYTVTSGALTSLPGTATLVVQGHKPPVAVEETVSYTLTAARPPIDIAVLANDAAEAGWSLVPGTLARVGAGGSAGGTVEPVEPASGNPCTATSTQCVMRYRPATGAMRGSETFSYRVRDNFGLWSNTVRVTVNIQ
jgi:FtsP/CotA-like multicopper oxidase with cupredoxin domain